MLIAKNDEEKRSKWWRYVTITATVLILVVAVYFVYKGFWGNPLEGRWQHDESDMILEVYKQDEAMLVWNDLFEGQKMEVMLKCSMDKEEKQVTFRASQEELSKAAEQLEGQVETSDVETAIQMLLTSFHYSVDGQKLTLIECDYGDQLLFTRLR